MSDDFLNAPSSLSINKKTSNLVALINWHRPVNIQQIERRKNLFFMRGCSSNMTVKKVSFSI